MAEQVCITKARGGLSPEEKLVTLQEVMAKEHTIFIGDGINDAPSFTAATVGIGLGTQRAIIGESTDVLRPEP